MSDLSGLNPTPHAIAVYASSPLSPVATQHSLPSGRYSLLGPDFHRLDRTSLRLAHSLDHLVGAAEQRGRHGLFPTLGLIGTIVRPTSIRSSRNSSQFLYLSPDRTEWAEPMLLFGKSVRIGAVWSIDRFLEPNGKILVEVRLLRPILAHDVACDVIGLLVHQQRGVETGAKWHVV